jgi:hypothetical protein
MAASTTGSNRAVWEVVLRTVAAIGAVIGLLLTWATTLAVITAVGVALAGVSQLAQVGRNGIQVVDTRLTRLDERVASVQESARRLSANVADRGVVMTLLPAEQEQAVEQAAQQAALAFANIRAAAETASNARNAVNGAMGVLTGKPATPTEGVLVTALDELASDAAALGENIRDFRAGRAQRVDRVAEAAGRLGTRVGEARAGLAELDQRLVDLQSGLAAANQMVRLVFGLTALLSTLAFLYVLWSQVLLTRRAWAARSAGPVPALPPPGASGRPEPPPEAE